MIDLRDTADLVRLLGDPSRLRLLALLARDELTVAELVAATRLAQSRVSSHLGRLREAGLLRVRPAGTSTYYALEEQGMPKQARGILAVLGQTAGDPLLEEDQRRLGEVVAARARNGSATAAGPMERHYSPGRTWEAAARALVGFARLGEVLDVASGDGALAELVAPRAASVTCLDRSPRVVEAGRRRLCRPSPLRFVVGDMHALPFESRRFDQVMLVNALNYAERPEVVVQEAARVLRPEGGLLASALARHRHVRVARSYDHVQMGFAAPELADLFAGAGLRVESCAITSRERRAPHFEILTLCARRPADGRRASERSP